MTFAERRIAFRRWRRVRPFWGGLLLIVSGLELLQSGYLDLGSIQVHFGYEGFLSYLLPAVMVLTGVFSWVTPKQRLFYGIIGMLTAVYSLIGLNLGGWFVGMLLGIVGGAMVLAWSPGPTSSEPTPDDTAADPGPSAPESSMDETVVRSPGMHRVPEEEPRGGANARWSFRFFAILIPALVLVSGLGLWAAHPAVAADCPTAPAAPAAAAAPAPTPSPSRTAKTAAELWREFWDRILGRNQPTPGPSLVEPTATPGPVPTCTEPAPTSPGAPPSATATDSGAPPAPDATTPGADGGHPRPAHRPAPAPARPWCRRRSSRPPPASRSCPRDRPG